MESILDLIKIYQDVIEKYPCDEQMVLKCIEEMYKMDITVQHLQETGIGRTVNALRKEPGDSGRAARALVYKWKVMVAAEESDQEGDKNNEVKEYNEHEQGRDNDSNPSKSKNHKAKPEKNNKIKNNEEKHKHLNGDHSGSKRKYCSSEEDEPDTKKSKYVSTKDNGYIKPEIKVKVEPSDSEIDSEDDSTSEEERKPDVKIKIEKIEKTEHVSPSNKHSSYSNHDRIKNEQGSENAKEHHKENTSEARYSSDKSSKDKSHSSRSPKSSKDSEKNIKIEKVHKSDKEKDKKRREDSLDKHKSSKEQKHTSHKSEKQKSYDNSEKRRSDSNTEKHNSEKYKSSSSNVEKHRSSSSSEKHKSSSEKSKSHSEKSSNMSDKHSSSKSGKDNLKSTSEKEISSDKHRSKEINISSSSTSKDKHSTASKERSKDKNSSPKEKSHSHKDDKKHSSSRDSSTKNSDSKKKSDSKRNESNSKKSKHKSSSEKSNPNKSKDDVPKKKSQSNGQDSDDGIDCGSGASFAEALGMISPAKPKKKSLTKESTHSPTTFTEDVNLATLLASNAKLAPLPTLEISALPEISPNYRPRPPPKFLPHFTDEDAMSAVISSKNQRTKVYSGNKVMGKIPTLYEMCVNILQEHIDALEYTGGVPYEILKPVVDKATPQQLFMLEHYNPYLMEDTDHLWQKFCEKSFRNKKRQELETWREMYMRCQEEQEIKLKSLTTNIRIAQEAKKAPIKQTKMAYVDSVVKPPRNVLKKQAQHGTAFAATASPAARVAALASAPNVLKGGRAAPAPVITPSSSALKPKKAPLMQKALQFMRGRKR